MSAALQRGLLLAQQGRNEQAVAELQNHLGTEPTDAFAHALTAMCLSDMEKFGDAAQHVAEAIQLQPDLSFAHYASAYVLFARNRFDEALGPIEEAIRLDPYHAPSHGLLARIHLVEKRHAKALAAAESGLEADPENVTCQNLRAMALKNLGRYNDAQDALESALARDPENSWTHANKGWALLEKNDHAAALKHFQEALRLEPDNDWAREGIVTALKSRYRIYSVMLRYFLWSSKLPRNVQWGLVVGSYVGTNIIGRLAATNSNFAPILEPIRMALFAFIIMTWIADPLFNLMLRLNPYGRLALNENQRRGSTLIGILVFISLVSAALFLMPHAVSFYGATALLFAILCIPASTIFRCSPGRNRIIMASYTTVLFLLAVTLLVMVGAEDFYGNKTIANADAFTATLNIFIIGNLGSQFLANYLLMRPTRR